MTESDEATESTASLRRAVFWAGLIAVLFAVGCALGVVFGIPYYDYLSAQPPSRLQAKAARLALLAMAEKGVMTLAFAFLARALFRYAGALKQSLRADETRARVQARCWRAIIWLALLYAGCELTSAIVAAMQ